jgi:hypothetical protein
VKRDENNAKLVDRDFFFVEVITFSWGPTFPKGCKMLLFYMRCNMGAV